MKTMPIVETAEDAIMMADDFLSRYYTWKHPLTARNDGDSWTALFDEEAITTRKIEMKVDCASGKILEFVGLDYIDKPEAEALDPGVSGS
jgi:hypothetical protein